MRAVSDTTLRSIRARRPHFVILRYLIAPFASSTTAEFGQKFSTSGRPITAKSMSSFRASGRVGCTASRMHEILKVRSAAASPMRTAVNLIPVFLQGIRQQAERRFPQRSVSLRADARLADATSAMNQTYGSRRALKQRAPQRQGQVN
jgi:hypothetical protein